MEYKYGVLPKEQLEDYTKRMHGMIHWLLIYQEEKNPALDNYFSKVQYKLDGINSLFKYPASMIEVMGLVESALLESRKENPSHKKFRKMILDAHETIDKMIGEINV